MKLSKKTLNKFIEVVTRQLEIESKNFDYVMKWITKHGDSSWWAYWIAQNQYIRHTNPTRYKQTELTQYGHDVWLEMEDHEMGDMAITTACNKVAKAVGLDFPDSIYSYPYKLEA